MWPTRLGRVALPGPNQVVLEVTIAHDAQRTPARGLSAAAGAEVDFLLARLATRDERARLDG